MQKTCAMQHDGNMTYTFKIANMTYSYQAS